MTNLPLIQTPPPATGQAGMPAPLWRRLAATLYECMLLFAVFFIFSYAFLALSRSTFPLPHPQSDIFSAYILLVFAGYFGYFWTHSGQTLAMKTWDIRLVNRAGQSLSWPLALIRYGLGWAGPILLAALLTFALMQLGAPTARATIALFYPLILALLIALFYGFAALDPQRRFIHDRWLGTQLIATPKKPPQKTQPLAP